MDKVLYCASCGVVVVSMADTYCDGCVADIITALEQAEEERYLEHLALYAEYQKQFDLFD